MEKKWYVDSVQKGIVRFDDDVFSGILAGTKAQQIVTAVNSHKELLNALKQSLGITNYVQGDRIEVEAIVKQIEKAIHNAENL